MSEKADELLNNNRELATVAEIDEIDCFGATRPILMLLFALWGGLMVVYALTAG